MQRRQTGSMLQREHIVRFMAARSAKPESANGLRKALRALMQHAVAMKVRADDPTQNVRPIAAASKRGFHTWDETEIERFEAKHPIGSKPRLALALGLFTGQARQDVIAMGQQHIRDEVLSWIRRKLRKALRSNCSSPCCRSYARSLTRPERPPDFPHDRVQQAIHRRRIRQLVSGPVQCGRAATLHLSRAAQGCCEAASRVRLHAARDRRHHWPCDLEGDRALHQGRKPKAARRVCNGQGETENRQ